MDCRVSTGELESCALGERGDPEMELGGRQARLERRGKDCLLVEHGEPGEPVEPRVEPEVEVAGERLKCPDEVTLVYDKE
jgi:hypothetical protein